MKTNQYIELVMENVEPGEVVNFDVGVDVADTDKPFLYVNQKSQNRIKFTVIKGEKLIMQGQDNA